MKKNTSQTAPLDDDIWMEEPVPDRYLCTHEHLQPHDLCPYPYPYSLDQLHLAPEYALTPQHFSDIFDFWDAMTTASSEDIPSLQDVLKLQIWTVVCIMLCYSLNSTHENGNNMNSNKLCS